MPAVLSPSVLHPRCSALGIRHLSRSGVGPGRFLNCPGSRFPELLPGTAISAPGCWGMWRVPMFLTITRFGPEPTHVVGQGACAQALLTARHSKVLHGHPGRCSGPGTPGQPSGLRPRPQYRGLAGEAAVGLVEVMPAHLAAKSGPHPEPVSEASQSVPEIWVNLNRRR